MTVSTTSAVSGPFVGNGSTTVFPFDFDVASGGEVQVLADGAVIASADYSVSVNAGGNGGSVTMDTAPATGVEILLALNPDYTQDIAFTNSGPFLPETHDEALDRAARKAIHLKSLTDRSAKVPIGETIGNYPAEADRADSYLAFDASGDPVSGVSRDAITGALSDIVVNAAAISSLGARVAVEEEISTRTVRAPSGETMNTLQPRVTRAGKVAGWDSGGHPTSTSLSGVLLGAEQSLFADSRIILAAYTGMAASQSAYLSEGLRAGPFIWSAADLSAEVALDPFEGVYVAPASDPTGASGAWVRDHGGVLRAEWFGGQSGVRLTDRTVDITGLPDQTPFLEAQIALAVAMNPTPEIDQRGVWSLATHYTINIPQSSNTTFRPGFYKAPEGVARNTGMTVADIGRGDVVGELYFSGNGGTTYADRLIRDGIAFQGITRSRFDYVRTDHVKRYGQHMETTSNNIIGKIGLSKGIYCGSARVGEPGAMAPLAFTARTDTGSVGSAGQRSVLTVGVGNIPDMWELDTLVHIQARPYIVKELDPVAGTVTFFPQIRDATYTSGTIESLHGGLLNIQGGDVSCLDVKQIDAHNCGAVLQVRGNWGGTTDSIVAQGCGVTLLVGRQAGGSHLGTVIGGFHSEGNTFDIVDIGTPSRSIHITGPRVLNLAKCFRLSPKLAGGDNEESLKGYTINIAGADHNSSIGGSYDSNSGTEVVSNSPALRQRTVSNRNSLTLTLSWDDEAARVFGNTHWLEVYCLGSGANNQPTGTITVNAGTVAVSTTSDGTTTVVPTSVANLLPGMQVTGTGVPANTTIVSVNKESKRLVLSNAVPAATNTLTYQYNVNVAGTVSKAFSGLTGPLLIRAAMISSSGRWQVNAVQLTA